MSFKYAAQRLSDGHYILKRSGTMKVDGHVLLSDELYATSEENVWQQLVYATSYEGVTGAYLMPDCHVGYSVPVGCVVTTDNTLIMAASGYDINCGMLLLRVDGLSVGSFKNRYQRERWVKAIERCIAVGIGVHRSEGMPSFTKDKLVEILQFGAKALGADPNTCERSFLPVANGTDFKAIPRAWERALPQLGSLGGGNHFVELQGDESDGSLWVMLHSGSRGYGYQTAEHFFRRAADLRGIPSGKRGEAWLRIDEPLGEQYWNMHNSAANYAIANRHIMADSIKRVFQDDFNADCSVFYEISHNLIQEETLALPDGSTQRGFVHRKGATRAMPGGHPDLVGTAWADSGHPCIIPGSMYEGAAVLRPQQGALSWACSVNHGSGRILARGAAKRKLEHKQTRIDDEMRTIKRRFGSTEVEGIVGNTKHVPLDECGHVYKSLDVVLQVLEDSKAAVVEQRLYPLANIKGTD